MAHPDLPFSAKTMMAATPMRWHHQYWHLVKNRLFVTNPGNAALVSRLAAIGWQSRFTGESGAGLDFLFMHRQMIGHMDHSLAQAGDPAWPKVIGWSEPPTDPDDVDWPVPTVQGLGQPDLFWPPSHQSAVQGIADARRLDVVAENRDYIALFRDPGFLRRPENDLDRLGFLIESTVHNWMHMYFSGPPPVDFMAVEPGNDWLGNPFSSHVNAYFWKLHGWIDDCIGHWEAARGSTADFKAAWRPPLSAPAPDILLGTPSLAPELAAPGTVTTSSIEPPFATIPVMEPSLFLTLPDLAARARDLIAG